MQFELPATLDVFQLAVQVLESLIQFSGCSLVEVAQHMFHLLRSRLHFTDLPFGVREFLTKAFQVAFVARSGSLGDSRFQLQRILSQLVKRLLRLLSIDKQLHSCFRCHITHFSQKFYITAQKYRFRSSQEKT